MRLPSYIDALFVRFGVFWFEFVPPTTEDPAKVDLNLLFYELLNPSGVRLPPPLPPTDALC